MDSVVVLGKSLLKQVAPQSVDLGEALTNHAKELGVRLFLRTALHDHGGKFWFLTGREVDLHEFVDSFLRIGTRHDSEIDSSP